MDVGGSTRHRQESDHAPSGGKDERNVLQEKTARATGRGLERKHERKKDGAR